MFVIDASVTLSWCFADEASEATRAVLRRLSAEEAVVPAIWPLEVANALRTAERRGRLDLGDLARVGDLLLGLPIRIEPVDLASALGGVADVARRLELTAYDAAYLGLAARRGLPLATVDERLSKAAVAAGVDLAA